MKDRVYTIEEKKLILKILEEVITASELCVPEWLFICNQIYSYINYEGCHTFYNEKTYGLVIGYFKRQHPNHCEKYTEFLKSPYMNGETSINGAWWKANADGAKQRLLFLTAIINNLKEELNGN